MAFRMKLVMAGGSVLLFTSAFLPFAAFFAPTVPIFAVAYPFEVWWFGYPLMVMGVGMLFLSIFYLSGRRALIHTIVGFLASAVAAIAILLSFLDRGGNGFILVILPYAFLPMLVGGLILAVGGTWAVRRSRNLALS